MGATTKKVNRVPRERKIEEKEKTRKESKQKTS